MRASQRSTFIVRDSRYTEHLIGSIGSDGRQRQAPGRGTGTIQSSSAPIRQSQFTRAVRRITALSQSRQQRGSRRRSRCVARRLRLPEGPALTSARPGRTHSPSMNVVGNARCHRSGHRDTCAALLFCLTARSFPGDRVATPPAFTHHSTPHAALPAPDRARPSLREGPLLPRSGRPHRGHSPITIHHAAGTDMTMSIQQAVDPRAEQPSRRRESPSRGQEGRGQGAEEKPETRGSAQARARRMSERSPQTRNQEPRM